MFTQKEKGELERQAVQVQKLDKIPITPEDKFAALKSTQAELAPRAFVPLHPLHSSSVRTAE